jgi:biopolymer transport protein TolR
MSPACRGFLIALLALGSSCTKSASEEPACPVGASGCACTAGGGCDPGLSCAASICTQEAKLIPFSLPKAAAGSDTVTAIVLVECARDGSLFVDGQRIEDERFDELVRTKRSEHADISAVLRCDEQVPTGRMISLIDRLRSNGISRYAFAVGKGPIPPQMPEEPPPAAVPMPAPEPIAPR